MFVLGNLLQATAVIIDRVLWIYSFVIFVSVMISWVSPDPYNPVVQFLRAVTEPVFAWIRRTLPFTVVGMLDLSPLAALLGIWFLRLFLVASLYDLSHRLG
ncbi:MAG TPA: YggT family protein [bacterium]